MWLPEARVAVRRCHTVGESCDSASAQPMCRGCLKNTFINRLEKHTYMGKFIGLATGCANGLQMLALGRHCCCVIDCSGDALWYAAQMHGFCIGCCSVRTSLQHVGCRCGSTVLRNDDAVVVHSVRNSASTTFRDCIADDAASVHHRACRLRCKVFATGVVLQFYSAASAMQYGRGSFALLILRDAFMRYTDVCRFFGIAGGCVSHDALTAVGGEIPKRTRTCFSEYLLCADATASGSGDYSVGIAHTPGGKCADTLSFPNFKATTSRRIRGMDFEHESREYLEGQRRVAPWCDRMDREPQKMPENRLPEVAGSSQNRFGMDTVLTHRLKRGEAIKACLLTQSFLRG